MRITMSRSLLAVATVLLLTSTMIVSVEACQSYYQTCGRRRQCCSGLNCSRDPGARPDETYCKEGTNSHNRLNAISGVQYAPYPWWAQDRSQRSSIEPVARATAQTSYPATLSYDYRIQPQQQYYY